MSPNGLSDQDNVTTRTAILKPFYELINIHALMLLDNRMAFCRTFLRSVDNNGKLIGDLNACFGCDSDMDIYIGHPGTTKYNGNRLLLLQL